ncbi:MAG: DUF1570 domain-containing protein [Planctomycetota bacterium]|jgi:hypothetical protein
MAGAYRSLYCHVLIATMCVLAPGPAALGQRGGGGMKRTETQYYTIYSNLNDEVKEREVGLRLTALYREFSRRSAGLRGGVGKMDCFVYKTLAQYHAAGGPARTSGCFHTRKGLMMAGHVPMKELGGVIQHEGFHQFAHYVISEDLPAALNEGLAMYFYASAWTGDSYVTGLLPSDRRWQVLNCIKKNTMLPLTTLLRVVREDWGKGDVQRNYNQAWALSHYLVEAEGGKHVKLLDRYLGALNANKQATAKKCLATIAEFEDDYIEWWRQLPLEDSYRREWKAVVATWTSFLARAHALGQRFESTDAFRAAMKDGSLKMYEIDSKRWLPPSLLAKSLGWSEGLAGNPQAQAVRPKEIRLDTSGRQPKIVLTCEDGTVITGSFRRRGGKMEIRTKVDLNGERKNSKARSKATKKAEAPSDQADGDGTGPRPEADPRDLLIGRWRVDIRKPKEQVVWVFTKEGHVVTEGSTDAATKGTWSIEDGRVMILWDDWLVPEKVQYWSSFNLPLEEANVTGDNWSGEGTIKAVKLVPSG